MNTSEVSEKLNTVRGLKAFVVDCDEGTKVQVADENISIRPGRGKRSLLLTEDGRRSFNDYLGTTRLAPQVSTKTAAMVANDLLAHKERFAYVIKDGQIIGFTTPRQFNNMNPDKVISTIEGIIEQPDFNRVMIDPANQTVTLEVIGAQNTAVAKGDLIRAGAMLIFNPLGIHEVQVQSYVLRLACTNGATSNTVLNSFSFGGRGGGDNEGKGDVWKWMRGSLRKAYNSYEKVAERWRVMMEENIPEADRVMVLNALMKEAGMTREQQAMLTSQALTHPPLTSYDMLNLMTWASSHMLESPAQVHRARHAAVTFQSSDSHERFCPVCRRQRGSIGTAQPVAMLPAPGQTSAS